MTSIFLHNFGFLSFDIEERLSQHKSHHSYAGNLLKVGHSLKKVIPTFMENHKEIVEEYLLTLAQTIIFACILYFSLSIISYMFFFKWKKEKYLPNYEGKLLIFNDIMWSLCNILGESILVSGLRMTLPRYSFVYYKVSDYGKAYIILSILMHIIFDETFTYWIHRIFHTNNFLYRHLHRIHHKSVDVTPFTGFSFHPLDAFGQAVPTFVSCFFFPLHYDVLLFFSLVTSVWAISIHDNVPALPIKLFLYSTHHTIHHEMGIGKFRNYGKFTSIWDRLAGTYSDPGRIDYGWIRNESTIRFFDKINYYIDKCIPDRTKKSKKETKKQQ